jgi:hypothetical protein
MYWGRLGRDRMVVRFTTTYATSAYHHWCCEFKSRSGPGVQHYMIKFVIDLFLRKVFYSCQKDTIGHGTNSTKQISNHSFILRLFLSASYSRGRQERDNRTSFLCQWNLQELAPDFDWQHICYVWWTCFSTDSRHTYGYKLCSSSSYASAAGMLLHINGKFTMGKLKSSLLCKVSFLT